MSLCDTLLGDFKQSLCVDLKAYCSSLSKDAVILGLCCTCCNSLQAVQLHRAKLDLKPG